MKRAAGARRVLTVLALVLATITATATPALAKVVTTCSGLCFSVDGSGNSIAREGVRINSLPNPIVTKKGHLQARWRSGGADRYKNSNETYINNRDVAWLALGVTVDPNTYVCGRFWHWNGSSWVLPYGNWQCILTHP